VSYKSQQALKLHMIFYMIFIIFITDLNEMIWINQPWLKIAELLFKLFAHTQYPLLQYLS